MTDFFYRVEESRYTEENGHKDIQIRAFPVIKTTPHGVWLNLGRWEFLPDKDNQKFVLRKNGKFAQPTIELAKKAFIRRKKIHIRMMRYRLSVIEDVLVRADRDKEEPFNLDTVNEMVAAWEKADEPGTYRRTAQDGRARLETHELGRQQSE